MAWSFKKSANVVIEIWQPLNLLLVMFITYPAPKQHAKQASATDHGDAVGGGCETKLQPVKN